MRDLLRIYGLNRYEDTAHTRHQMVMSLFSKELGENPRSSHNILFRLEKSKKGAFFLIRSDIPTIDKNAIRSITEQHNLEPSSGVSFRVTLNPVKRVRSTETPITDQQEQEEWALQKLSTVFKDVHILNQNTEVILRKRNSKDSIQLLQVDGVGTVNNLTELEAALTKGIGRSKAYGAGLLSIKKLT